MTSTEIPRDLRLVVETARSEAKRRGHGDITAGHLVVALVKEREDLATRLGADPLTAVERQFSQVSRSYGEPQLSTEADAILRECLGPRPVEQLADRLSVWIKESPPAVARSSAPADSSPPGMEHDAKPPGAGPTALIPDYLTSFVVEVDPDPSIVGRDDVVGEVLVHLRARHRITPLVIASEGAGRTSLLDAIAARICQLPPGHSLGGRRVVRVLPEAVIAARRAETLMRVLEGLGPQAVIGIDDVEVLAGLGSSVGVDVSTIAALRSAVTDPERSLVLLLARDYLDRLRAVDRELVDELDVIDLPDLTPEAVERIARKHARELEAHHGVELSDEVIRLACGPVRDTDRVSHPSLAIVRLDRAAATAGNAGRAVTPADLESRARGREDFDPARAVQQLREAIVGQDNVLQRVVDRLVVTRSGLDERPDRPDGVFLFVGPTGVGKTALAQALAKEVYGRSDAVLRLDMSEYAEPHTVSKLVGSPPGYVGSTDPESWLTTRVRTNPEVVLVLDEIEKAHPQVWNTFLQVFDAGRLTDSHGRTADFRDTVVVMTSNLGAQTFTGSASVGFGDRTPSPAAEEGAVLRAVKDRMAPELVNRLDEILVFRPLDRDAVTLIARRQLARTIDRLRSKGFELTIDDDALARIVDEGMSREYGARPLLRAIERLVISPTLQSGPGARRAVIRDGSLRISGATEDVSGA